MTNFDERAKNWDADPSRTERALAVAECIRSTLPLKAGMTAIEYGCGTGLLSLCLQKDFASITLADSSQGMLDILSEKIKSSGVANMYPIRLDLASDPLPVSRFDISYSLMTLHHIPEIEPALKNFFELLNPDGWLCIADLDSEDGSFHGESVTDVHKGFERSLLQKQVEAAGFRNVSFTTVCDITKQIDGSEKSFPVFLLTACRL